MKCPKCGEIKERINFQDTTDRLIGLVYASNGKGKNFSRIIDGALPSKNLIDRMESEVLNDACASLPSSLLPKWSGIVNPAMYGISTHSDFLNKRQRLVPIPAISATYSGAIRPPIPVHSGRLFRRIPATPSERSDAGVEISFAERLGRVKL